MSKRLKEKIKKFKELDDKVKLMVLLLLIMLVRQCWILLQILWVVINNIIQMLG